MSESWAERVVAEVTGWRLPRWAVVTAILGAVSLIMVLICLSILLISAQNNLDEQRRDASCRADVTLEINLGTAGVVDELARIPRDPVLVAKALSHLHDVRAAAETLQKNKSCGYGGFIPTPTSAKP